MGEKSNQHTLCWDCENAVEPEICPWANDGTPVPGWLAVRTRIKSNRMKSDSYRVLKCPLFKRDSIKSGMKPWKEGDKL